MWSALIYCLPAVGRGAILMISSAVPACRRAGMPTLQIIIQKKTDKIK